jgi:hypothetical protein
MNDQMQCKQDVFKAQVVSEYAALNVFSELLPSEVLLDDELLHYLDSQGGYFQQVTSNGEHLAGGDSKQMVEASIDDVLTNIAVLLFSWSWAWMMCMSSMKCLSRMSCQM